MIHEEALYEVYVPLPLPLPLPLFTTYCRKSEDRRWLVTFAAGVGESVVELHALVASSAGDTRSTVAVSGRDVARGIHGASEITATAFAACTHIILSG